MNSSTLKLDPAHDASGSTSGSCDHCHNLERYCLIIRISALREGAASGCTACELLNDSIALFSSAADNVFAIQLLVECALYVDLFTKEDKYLKTVEVYTELNKPCIWSKIGPGKAVAADPSSFDCIQLAQTWLRSCLEHHSVCTPPESTPLPTRVIDVGESDSDVRLYATHRENARYAALSHCWGESQATIATTAETLPDRLKTIQFDPASQTFADTVRVTRQLGLRYLWIDSLCIIQRDANDWAIEAGRMSDIYRNATIVLSADAAEDTSQGLFSTPATRSSKHRSYSLSVPGPAGPSTVYCRLRASNPTSPTPPPHSSSVLQPTRLSTRGWVLQERLLSPRMLHFYAEELVWSCSSLTHCECRYQPSISTSGTFRRMVTTATNSSGPQDILTEWTRIVSDFTTKNLTMPSDRLAAIAGLAGLTDPAVSSTYHCGLWRSDMEQQVLWASNHSAEIRTTRCSPSAHAPSWSWASITGPVHYFDRFRTQFEPRSGRAELKPLLTIDLVSTTPLGPNPYGPSRGGSLVVTGQLLPVCFVLEPRRVLWRPLLESFFHEDPKVEPSVIFDVPDEGFSVAPADHGTHSVLFPGGDFFFLRAAIYISGGVWSTPARENLCLLLKKEGVEGSSGLDLDVFTRAALVMFGFDTDTVWNEEITPRRRILIK